MASILLKRSSTPGQVPSGLQNGEPAFNLADHRMFIGGGAAGGYDLGLLAALAFQCGGIPRPRVPGIAQPLVPYAVNAATATTLTLTSNRIYLMPFVVLRELSISQLSANVTTAAAGIHQIGIYDSNNNAQPQNRLGMGQYDAGTTGVKTVTVSLTLRPGIYWAAYAAGSAAAVRAVAVTGLMSLGLPSLGTASTTMYALTGSTLPSSAPTSGYIELNSAAPAIGVLY
jgi:hypothetical protein